MNVCKDCKLHVHGPACVFTPLGGNSRLICEAIAGDIELCPKHAEQDWQTANAELTAHLDFYLSGDYARQQETRIKSLTDQSNALADRLIPLIAASKLMEAAVKNLENVEAVIEYDAVTQLSMALQDLHACIFEAENLITPFSSIRTTIPAVKTTITFVSEENWDTPTTEEEQS